MHLSRSTFVLTTALLAWASPAAADTAERSIRGWSSTGQEVIVDVVQRGERMVDGISEDYYFEGFEVYGAQSLGAQPLQRFKTSEPVGPLPETLAAAKAPDVAAKRLETLGVTPGDSGAWERPQGDRRLVSVTTHERTESNGKFQCTTRHRVGLMDQKEGETTIVADRRFGGETSRRRDEAKCPKVKASPSWSTDGERWAILVESDSDAWVYAGGTGSVGGTATFDFTRRAPLVAELEEDPKLKAGFEAIARSDFDAAKTAFQAVDRPEAKLLGALVDAWRGDKKGQSSAKKAADAAWKASEKTAWEGALRAAVYRVADDARSATRIADEAVKQAKSYDELLRMAALFDLVDVQMANQLAVWALSHDSAVSAQTDAGWTLLAKGLLDRNEFSKSKESLAKVDKKEGRHDVVAARHALDQGKEGIAEPRVHALVDENPADCEALLLLGRQEALAGENVTARQLFGAAAFCDPTLSEAQFYGADFARLVGDTKGAAEAFAKYVEVAPPRMSDPVVDARRAAATRWSERLGHSGAVLLQAQCDRGFCRGVVANTTNEQREVEVQVTSKRKTLASQKLQLEPGSTSPFGLRVEGALSGAEVTVGSDARERKINAMEVR